MKIKNNSLCYHADVSNSILFHRCGYGERTKTMVQKKDVYKKIKDKDVNVYVDSSVSYVTVLCVNV